MNVTDIIGMMDRRIAEISGPGGDKIEGILRGLIDGDRDPVELRREAVRVFETDAEVETLKWAIERLRESMPTTVHWCLECDDERDPTEDGKCPACGADLAEVTPDGARVLRAHAKHYGRWLHPDRDEPTDPERMAPVPEEAL